MTRMAFIAMGSNLGDPRQNLDEAIRRFDGPRTRGVVRSRIYRSEAVGPGAQPSYLNAVVEAETDYAPIDLLAWLKAIEASMGRLPSLRWSPRVIDLDIVLFAHERVAHPRLIIPHPALTKRSFVLRPLADLAPDWFIPGEDLTVREALVRLDDRQAPLEIVDDPLCSLSGLRNS